MKTAHQLTFFIICLFQLEFSSAVLREKRSLKENFLQMLIKSDIGFKINPVIFSEANLEATELVKLYGYPIENQTVTTEDNYTLIIHRIPHGKDSNLEINSTRIPVLLLHSLGCQSSQWFDSGPKSLAFVLADEGYDVWVANFRGTSHSYHSVYSRDKAEFWNFCFDDFVTTDLPAIIDHVLSTTGYSKLLLIGHSLGASVCILTLAVKPEYNDKVAGFISMAPIIHPKYVTMIWRPILSQINLLEYFIKKSERFLWNNVDSKLQQLSFKFCPDSNPILCEFPSYTVFGYSPYLRNRTRFLINGQHCEMGVPKKIILQMIQVFKNNGNDFTLFDYGTVGNQEKYYNILPPAYDFSRITSPGVIYYAPNDCVATPLDVEILAEKIPSLVGKEVFPNPTASHADFTWAASAKELVYDKVITYLRQMWK